MGGEAEDGFAAEAGGAACYEEDFVLEGGDGGGVEGGGHGWVWVWRVIWMGWAVEGGNDSGSHGRVVLSKICSTGMNCGRLLQCSVLILRRPEVLYTHRPHSRIGLDGGTIVSSPSFDVLPQVKSATSQVHIAANSAAVWKMEDYDIRSEARKTACGAT